MENISNIDRIAGNDNNTVNSFFKLEKASIKITSRFEGSDRLIDLLLAKAITELESNVKKAKTRYFTGGDECYNKLGS
jgi:hypothetical protein